MERRARLAIILGIGLVPLAFAPSARAADPLVWTVNTTATTNDGTCDATHCSLPEAINAANLNDGPDIVAFDIPSTDPGCHATTGVCTISPQTPLEQLVDGETTIDGFTQPGASPNTNPFGQPINAAMKIVLDGSQIPYYPPGIWITSAGNRVRGLVIQRFYEGISLQQANDNRIEGNFIGPAVLVADDHADGHAHGDAVSATASIRVGLRRRSDLKKDFTTQPCLRGWSIAPPEGFFTNSEPPLVHGAKSKSPVNPDGWCGPRTSCSRTPIPLRCPSATSHTACTCKWSGTAGSTSESSHDSPPTW